MSRRPILVLLVALAIPSLAAPGAAGQGLPRGDARAEGFAPERLGRIRELLQEAVDRKQIAGGSALVARRGKVVTLATAGRADVEAGRPVDEATLFRIASMTKPIASAAILILHDEGKLRLTD